MKSFNQLNLNPLLMRAVTEMGFETPTPIQAKALPILLGEPTDFLGLAATGTGKTVAFGIPLLEKIDPSRPCVQGLILCPTRELALQVSGQINLLAKHLGLSALPIYGGSSYTEQIRGLRQGATIVVGTPGRVVDHMERGTLDLSEVETIILDEADEMISMGFKEDLETILSNAPRDFMRVWLFSATMGREVATFAEKFLQEAEEVQVNQTEIVPDRIEQIYYRVHEGDKPEVICKLIDAAPEFYGIIFCQTKALVTDLTQYLKSRGFAADCLHGDMDQNARERTMTGFRNRRYTVLVCTDVASRGLDVKDITHVINYSLPRELENYVHRIGRTARSGKTGFAMSLVTPSHRNLIPRIEHVTKSKMREGKLPTRKEIGMKKVTAILTKFQEQTAGFSRAAELMDESWKSAIAGMSGQEIAARFLALTFPEIFEERAAVPGKPAVAASPRPGSPTHSKPAVIVRPAHGPKKEWKGQPRPATSYGQRSDRKREPRGEAPWKVKSHGEAAGGGHGDASRYLRKNHKEGKPHGNRFNHSPSPFGRKRDQKGSRDQSRTWRS